MIIALRTDLKVLFDLFAVNDLLAVVALDPQAFRNLHLLGRCVGGQLFRSFFFEPSHKTPTNTKSEFLNPKRIPAIVLGFRA
jgi:hypothetical protein